MIRVTCYIYMTLRFYAIEFVALITSSWFTKKMMLIVQKFVWAVSSEVTCGTCKKTFSNKYNLAIHILDQHDVSGADKARERPSCPECGKQLFNNSGVNRHLREVHGIDAVPKEKKRSKRGKVSTKDEFCPLVLKH